MNWIKELIKILSIGKYLLIKEDQDINLIENYKEKYGFD